MTDIDPEDEISISVGDGQVTAALPLAGPVTQEWHHRYDALAGAQGIPARIMQREEAWIVVILPMPADRADIEATMDAARHLITKMQTDDQAAAAAEGILREWWARQRT